MLVINNNTIATEGTTVAVYYYSVSAFTLKLYINITYQNAVQYPGFAAEDFVNSSTPITSRYAIMKNKLFLYMYTVKETPLSCLPCHQKEECKPTS